MKRVREPIEVQTSGRQPVSFRWRGQDYHITSTLHTWKPDKKHWWKRETQKRRYYRVHARHGHLDLHRVTAEISVPVGGREGKWVLSALLE